MKILQDNFLLRLAVAVVLLMHSVPTILNGGINAFGTQYLDPLGFAPLGLPIAWAIKLSHIVCAVCLVINKYVKWPVIITIGILVMGIIMIHYPNGWYVVGGGRNGIEFNFLMIAVLLTFVLPKKL